MIEPNRPLKAVAYQRPNCLGSSFVANDAFDHYTSETLDLEGMYDDKPGAIVESCHATWFEKDGRIFMDFEQYSEVRCLEPAVWYVKLGNSPSRAGGAGSYCDFHRPRVMPQ